MADANALRVSLRRRAEEGMARTAAAVQAGVGLHAPRRSTPSSLHAGTFRNRRISGAPRVTYSIEATAQTAEWTNKGTRPHVIRPRKAGGVLVFYWPKAGRRVFLRHVNHPGNRSDPWFRTAVERLWPDVLRREWGRLR